VGYYLDGRFTRKGIGRPKAIAEKARGDIKARLERGDARLLNRDYPVLAFSDEYLNGTTGKHAPSYHNRNQRVREQFKRLLKAERPHLKRLSRIRPEVIEACQRFRLAEAAPRTGKPIKKRIVNIEPGSLKAFSNKAIKWDMLSTNPMEGVDYLKKDDSKKIRALTEEDAGSSWRISRRAPGRWPRTNGPT
jgi:hypothetical protein